MKRIVLLFVVGGLLAGEVSAQQQSSRRTRKIEPQNSGQTQQTSQKQSVAEQLKQQASQIENAASTAESPFQDYSDTEAQSNERRGIRVASGGEFKPTPSPEPRQEANAPGRETVATPPSSGSAQVPSAGQENAINQGTVEVSNPAARKENVIDGSKAISTRVVTSSEINVGQAASVSLYMRNESPVDLTGAILTVRLSEQVDLQFAEPQPTEHTESIAIWHMPTMPSGQQTEIKLNVVPFSKQPINIETEISIKESSQVSIAVRQPELKMTVTSAEKAIVGQLVAHKIKIWNEGDGTAEGLGINLELPGQSRLIDSKGDPVTIGSLGPGEARELTLQTQTDQAGESPIVYHLSGQGVSLQQAGKIDFVVPELYAEILGPKVNIPGRDGSYTINVNNPCEVDLNDTTILLQLPKGMEVTLLSREGDFDAKAGTISWNMATLQPGASESIQFKARLLDNNDQQCHVFVESRETASNQLAFETRAYVHTELKLAMKNVSGPVNVGDLAEFVVTASNTGHTAASSVSVSIEIPEWITPEADSAYRIDSETSRLVFNAVDVPEGMAAEFKFKGTCTTAGSFVVRSSLVHASQTQPMISDASLFVLDTQTERVGSSTKSDKVVR